MSKVREIPLTGYANSNADVSAYLRELARNIESGEQGEVRQCLIMVEVNHQVDTYVCGGPCDNARVVGLINLAISKFIGLMQ